VSTVKRLAPKERRNTILDAAIRCAQTGGFYNVTRADIAREAGVSEGLVTHYCGTMPQLRRAIMRAAIHRGVLPVIAQGLASGDPQAIKAPQDLKDRAAQAMAG